MTQKGPLEAYYDLMLSNGAVMIYRKISEMNLFSDLTPEQEFSVEDFCKKKDLKLQPTKMLFQSLVTLGLLNQSANGFRISPVLMLLRGNYQNLSTEYWDHLPELLKTGTPFKRMDQVTDSEKEYQSQVKALEWMMKPCAKSAFDILSDKRELKVLDVGAGSGVWSFQFLYENPSSKATLVDWPMVLKVARATAETNKISDRVSYIESNYHEAQIPAGTFDYAILGNVTHIETEEGNRKLLDKIYHALKPGGKLLIFDAYGKDPKGALARSLYQMGLTIRTVQGQVFFPEELEVFARDAGFREFDFHSLPVVPYSMGMFICKR